MSSGTWFACGQPGLSLYLLWEAEDLALMFHVRVWASHHQGAAHAHNKGHGGGSGHHTATAEASDTVKDPVCGMSVDPTTAKHRAQYQGAGSVLFQVENCQSLKFMDNPGKYVQVASNLDHGSGSAGGHDLSSDAPPDPSGRSGHARSA
ncbi:hypothetical protein DPM13_01345 [Paracoccus mutanolyticus]|uniref:Uncharacterized protein n=1 Tax=Paracoccus mutanolyticus TaxID=1499308 RepID=A0ABN5M3D8_9RHOB|nr:hypothetical protein DPM13_01345 [Paracoccus mutanolyticus]